MNDPFEDDVLRALRRITRAIDLHSRHLSTTYGLTGPQLVCLRVIGEQGPVSPSQLAREVALSQATITGILDRLSTRNLITRSRVSSDRRVVTVAITEHGRTLIMAAPSPLQEHFLSGFAALPIGERTAIRDTLNRLVQLMDGDHLDAAPMLSVAEDLITDGIAPDTVAPGDSPEDGAPSLSE